MSDDDDLILPEGVVLRAKNGDVIRYDETGLILRLSDRVVADLALRLGHAAAPDTPTAPPAAPPTPPDGIDAWDLRLEGPWLRFTARLPGAQGVRAYRQHIDGGDIIAEALPPIQGLLGLGGARAALANRAAADFPHHILAPADDIGAVGHAGVGTAATTDRFEHLREMTHEALVAQTILHWRMEDYGPLPLFVTRVETDSSATASELSCGKAVENLLIAARNLRDGAALMGKRAILRAVCLDYALEDFSDTATDYRDGMLATMEAVSNGLWALGFDRPLFVMRLEAGLAEVAPQAALDGQWELSWNHGDHRLLVSAPSYMFALDATDRPTDAARIQQAEMTALAIAEADTWLCPRLHLAETEGAGDTLRVTARAAGPLVLDGPHGFAVDGCTITDARIAADDPQAVLLQLDTKPAATATLTYATNGAPGGLRDTFTYTSATGATLHRWALPARLPIHGGRYA